MSAQPRSPAAPRLRRREHAEDTRRRLALATLLTGLSRRFLEAASPDIDAAIDSALESVGRVAEVDRAYLFVLDADETHMTNTHEWCAPGVGAEIEEFRDRPTAPYVWWMNELRTREVVYVADRDDLRDVDSAEYQSLLDQGIRSLITIPIRDGARLTAFVGFDIVERTTLWSPDALALLRHLADLLASALRKRDTEAALRRSEARSRAMLAAIPDLMLRVAADGTCLEAQVHDPRQLDLPAREAAGRLIADLLPRPAADAVTTALDRALATGDMQVVEYERATAGEPRVWEARLVQSTDDEAICIVRDITERRRHEQRLAHEAAHDALTGLPNRRRLHEDLDHALARARRSGRPVALLFIDLDRFKTVNDTLGHAAGDELLAAAAERLRHVIREVDTPARFGGDEFAVVCTDLADPADAIEVAERVRDALRVPFDIRGTEFTIGASVGIAVADGTVEAETLLRRADAAAYRAKEEGRDRYALWSG